MLEALGEVNAARFITLLNRDPFDYTTWQKNLFGDLNVGEISSKTMDLKEEKPITLLLKDLTTF
ncbi:hypothetical protein [Mucilaginibacter sp.]|uniref:hypothetical protein n=1 Tax=Mucilaginibacter sp. TaxID=1882438 RepID=UPI00262B96CD|nr:hypothetical protein [Mucilaginibacter sp.]MDB4919760.1 hypothetical protein [Mucilaginibacter sp.]